MRSYGDTQRQAGIAIESAGNIDSEDTHGSGIDGSNDAIKRGLDRAAKTAAEQGIDNPVGIR